MRKIHPFATLAPYFALGAFLLTAAESWLRHMDSLWIVGSGVLAFYAMFYIVRFCASFLGAAEPSPPPLSTESGESGPGRE